MDINRKNKMGKSSEHDKDKRVVKVEKQNHASSHKESGDGEKRHVDITKIDSTMASNIQRAAEKLSEETQPSSTPENKSSATSRASSVTSRSSKTSASSSSRSSVASSHKSIKKPQSKNEESMSESCTSESGTDDSEVEEYDDEDGASETTEELIKADPLYQILQTFFVSESGKSIANILEDISNKLSYLKYKQ